jgi:uridine kinase
MTPSPSETEVLCRVEQLLSQQERVLVALDGRCAAGKTTLARHFQERFGWQVFHMDDFFLRPEQRTEERLAQPGENVDHERFFSEVLLPLRAGLLFQYRPYDCHTGQLRPPVQAVPAPVSLVEGSYACHPALWDLYDLRLFLTVEPQEQMSRILSRNGPEQAQVFQDMWIPLEERYFAAFRLDSRCDFLLSGSL